MLNPEDDQNHQDLLVKKEIGARIRRWRKMRNLTQEELGALIGASKETVSQYESGGRGTASHDLPRIARALNISVAQLFDENPIPFVQAADGFDFEKIKKLPTARLYSGMTVTEIVWSGFAYLTAMQEREQQIVCLSP